MKNVAVSLMAILFAACSGNKSPHSLQQEKEDLSAKELLQGIWLDDETESPLMRVEGDTIYYADAQSTPIAFKIMRDILYTYGNDTTYYKIDKQGEHIFWFHSITDNVIKLHKSEDLNDSIYFVRQELVVPTYTEVTKRDSVVTYNGTRYRAYVYINPSKMRVIKTTYSEDFRYWQTQKQPSWAHLKMPEIDYQAISYYADPTKGMKKDGPKSLDEIDPELMKTFDKLGIPLEERLALSGTAVDAVMDSVSVKTTFKEKLSERGIIFCSISEAVREYPDLVKQYLGSVVPYRDNYFAALNSAVFSDGSFVYIPKGVRCPMELSTYFRINARNTGQFERTLIVCDDGGYVSYLEGCTAPMRDENQLHAAIVEIVVNENAEVKYSTVQNWYPGDAEGRGGVLNLVRQATDGYPSAF
mgnify:CR=1 FL=1